MVLGPLATGADPSLLRSGMVMELVLGPLVRGGRRGTGDLPVEPQIMSSSESRSSAASSVWECTHGASGVATSWSTAWWQHAPRSTTPASSGRDVQFVAGGETIRNGYPGFVSGATFAQALGLAGRASGVELRRMCERRHRDGHGACADPRRVVRRRHGDRRRHHTKGLPRAEQGRARRRPRLAAIPPARRHEPHVLRVVRRAVGWTCTAPPATTSRASR